MNCTKLVVYRLARAIGLFDLCRFCTRNGLRVLCYHGVWKGANERFSGTLFMRPETFARRMRRLKELKYPVLPLDEAARRLQNGTLPPNATVITADDGFHSTYALMVPELERHSFPATIYVTTYYLLQDGPITQLLLRYVMKSSAKDRVQLDPLEIGLRGSIPINEAEKGEQAAALVLDRIKELSHDARLAVCHSLAEQLKVDLTTVLEERRLELMTEAELRDLVDRGFDVQLHTHRHRISKDGSSVLSQELHDNRAALKSIAARPLVHFCYPSGIYSPEAWPELEAAGVQTATTCVSGMNYPTTHRFEWRRTLDGETLTSLEFEAELCGFADLMRHMRARLGRGHAQASP